MVKNNDKLWQLIADKMGGALSDSDRRILDEMMKDPVNRSIYDILTKEEEADNTNYDAEYSEDVYNTIKAKIYKRNVLTGRLRYISIAASLILCIICGYALGHILPEEKVQSITYNCVTGGYSSFLLPDDTKVYVNSGTKLIYPSRFSGKCREVEVDGEAYFEVTKDEEKPFIVKTDNISVKVLGTAFNLKSYSSDSTSVLSLISGSVEYRINGSDEAHLLRPDEQVVLSKNTGRTEVKGFDTEYLTAWKEGNLSFAKISLGELCKILEHRFGYKIIIENCHLSEMVLTGSFANNESIFQILDVIKINTNFSYHLNNGVIVLK